MKNLGLFETRYEFTYLEPEAYQKNLGSSKRLPLHRLQLRNIAPNHFLDHPDFDY
jgi:hypothetical protein